MIYYRVAGVVVGVINATRATRKKSHMFRAIGAAKNSKDQFKKGP